MNVYWTLTDLCAFQQNTGVKKSYIYIYSLIWNHHTRCTFVLFLFQKIKILFVSLIFIYYLNKCIIVPKKYYFIPRASKKSQIQSGQLFWYSHCNRLKFKTQTIKKCYLNNTYYSVFLFKYFIMLWIKYYFKQKIWLLCFLLKNKSKTPTLF